MKLFDQKAFLLGTILLLTQGCSQNLNSTAISPSTPETSPLYAKKGTEHKVHFQALYRTNYRRLSDIQNHDFKSEILEVTPFLFGPLTHRSIGGVQKGETVFPNVDAAYLENSRVVIPYDYKATWLIQRNNQNTMELPLPFSITDIENSNWKSCTETDSPDHSTWSFLWYFWDPSRPGCTNQIGVEYQNIIVDINEETIQTTKTFPEYANMIRNINGVPTLEMTFGFGYVEDQENPNPFTDSDYGVQQFQSFYRQVKAQLIPMGFKETPVLQSEFAMGNKKIGALFTGMKNGTVVKITIAAAAGVDQMDIFATSYAQKHQGFFGWFGHSRVGAGFDAQVLRNKLRFHPDRFSISNNYQLVYWAGCNSYSYYTVPFFDMKSELDPQNDPRGTKHLDIISNTLPSLFAFNAPNANILLQALINWEQPSSYQTIVDRIENFASGWGSDVMVNVLGDEDNN